MRLETRGSLQFSGDSRLEALEPSLLGPRTQGLCPWVLGATGECPGVVSEVVSGVVSGTSEVRNSLLRGAGPVGDEMCFSFFFQRLCKLTGGHECLSLKP